jgi:hypothetical protein
LYEVSGAFGVAVGAASKAEVGVVELTERDIERRLEASVDVVRDREPFLGLLVLAEQGRAPGERPGEWPLTNCGAGETICVAYGAPRSTRIRAAARSPVFAADSSRLSMPSIHNVSYGIS